MTDIREPSSCYKSLVAFRYALFTLALSSTAGLLFARTTALANALNTTVVLPDSRSHIAECRHLLQKEVIEQRKRFLPPRLRNVPLQPGETFILSNLKSARKQRFGNCNYQAELRVREYAYEAFSSKPINLSVQYYSAQNLCYVAEMAARDLRIPLEKINPDSNIDFTESNAQTFGFLPESEEISDELLLKMQSYLRFLIRNSRRSIEELNPSGRPPSSTPRGLEIRRETEKIQRETIEAIHQYRENLGLNPNRPFPLDGQSFTPLTLANSTFLGLIHLDEVTLLTAEERMDSTSRSVRAYADLFLDPLNSVFRNDHEVHSTADLGDLIEDTVTRGLPIKLALKPFRVKTSTGHIYFSRKDIADFERNRVRTFLRDRFLNSDSEGLPGHALVIVGIERTLLGELNLILQNSWGPTSVGEKGLLKLSLSDAAEHQLQIAIPMI